MITLSIITVVKNSKALLQKTVESVREQFDHHPDLKNSIEYVIVDGGSDDGTETYINSIECSFAKIYSQKDYGIYDAMNRSVLKAKGNFIQFLNAGDVFHTSSSLLNIFEKLESSVPLHFFGYKMGNESYIPEVSFWGLIGGMPCHQAIVYGKSVLIEDPFDLRFRITADYHHLLSSIEKYPFKKHNEIVVSYDKTGFSSNPKLRREIRVNGLKVVGMPIYHL
jgi:glycosyltransferase involved in cell wall biosynthesis